MRRLLPISAAVLTLLAAVPSLAAPPPPAPEPGADPRVERPVSAYGAFLAGRAAYNAGETRLAAGYLAAAHAAAPDAPLAADRAFASALLAGDVDLVVALAPGREAPIGEIGRVAAAVQALAGGDARAVHADWRARPLSGVHRGPAAFLAPWLAAAAGDWDAALAAPPADADPLTRLFGEYHQAQLLEHRRRHREAEAIYRRLLAERAGAPLVRQAYGEFLERRGRRAEAVALYDAALAGGEDSRLRQARDRAARRGRAPAGPTLAEGAAQALYAAGGAAMVAGGSEIAIVYLRFSLVLSPGQGETLLMLGEALTQAGLASAAREAWAAVPADSPVASDAGVMLAYSLQDAGETDQALSAARAAFAADPTDPDAGFALASLLNAQQRHDEALQVLSAPALAQAEDWRVRLVRGAAYERSGDLPRAQAELQAALALQPDSPEVLNYLGYLWIDHGERVEEGVAMVERALEQEPDSGAYQDSLAWGRYRQGRYGEAVELLERAIALEPADPVITDHLGDAYWRVGRRREAEFQWRRVLTLEPDDALRATVEAKLAEGLPAGPMTAADNGHAAP